MLITFREKEHIYTVSGNIADISVTELLHKFGLAPNYEGANKEVLRKAAEEGKKVHKDLEYVLNKANYTPKTKQGESFAKWVKENLDCGVGEQKLGFITDVITIAGTADVMGFLKDGTPFIADHKNTSQFHKEYVEWQTSLLDYMARKLGSQKVNGKALNWKGAKKRFCFLYDKETGELDVKELGTIPDEEIERLINCEIKGEIYQRPALVVDNELIENFEKAEKQLIAVEENYKQAKARVEEFRAKLLQLMEFQKIKSWESPDRSLKVIYIAPTSKAKVDSKKLKHDFPLAYSSCLKVENTKSSIRILKREVGDEF